MYRGEGTISLPFGESGSCSEKKKEKMCAEKVSGHSFEHRESERGVLRRGEGAYIVCCEKDVDTPPGRVWGRRHRTRRRSGKVFTRFSSNLGKRKR